MRGWGWIRIRPSRDSDAKPAPFSGRCQMRTRRITHKKKSQGTESKTLNAKVKNLKPKRF
jgi:hypothetical protein